MATVGACGIFAAVSGSSMATAMVMGRMAYPEMKKYNYSDELSSGCICAGGSVGIMIPPSIQFIVIGILTEVSIGKLFMAGIIPGITQVLFYVVTIAIMCKIKPSLGPAAINLPMKEKVGTLKTDLAGNNTFRSGHRRYLWRSLYRPGSRSYRSLWRSGHRTGPPPAHTGFFQ